MKINLVIKVQESCLYNLECMQGTKKLSIWILLHSSVPPGTKVLLVFPVIKADEVLVSAEPVLSDDEVVAASVVCNGNKAFLLILDMGGRGVIDALGNHER